MIPVGEEGLDQATPSLLPAAYLQQKNPSAATMRICIDGVELCRGPLTAIREDYTATIEGRSTTVDSDPIEDFRKLKDKPLSLLFPEAEETTTAQTINSRANFLNGQGVLVGQGGVTFDVVFSAEVGFVQGHGTAKDNRGRKFKFVW